MRIYALAAVFTMAMGCSVAEPSGVVVSFPCTGSMEPTISCEDTALMELTDTAEVGDLVSFMPVKECGLTMRHTVHRVVAVRESEREREYRLRGDAAGEDDDCWIPESHLEGRIVSIERNVRPQNKELRRLVNDARSTFDRALTTYMAQAGRGLCDSWMQSPDMCLTQESILHAYENAASAKEAAECWIDAAKSAAYLTNGPPIFISCERGR